MAAVLAELKFRDGQRQKISVKVENTLSSLSSGIHELSTSVSQFLGELVEREKARGDCAQVQDDEDSDDEDEEPEEENSEPHPPAKRFKT